MRIHREASGGRPTTVVGKAFGAPPQSTAAARSILHDARQVLREISLKLCQSYAEACTCPDRDWATEEPAEEVGQSFALWV